MKNKEKKYAKELICIWLRKYNNDPHLAFNTFIKTYLEWNMEIPYWMTESSLDDFIAVSKRI